MTPWFIVLGAFLVVFGILFLIFRRRVLRFLGDLREVMYGRRDRGFLGLRPVETPIAGALGMIAIGAVYLVAGVIAAIEQLPWDTA